MRVQQQTSPILNNSSLSNIVFGLAPMEGVSCFATRLWIHQASQPDFCMTPFLRITPSYPWHRVAASYAPEILQIQKILPYKMIPQLMGTSIKDIARIAEHLLIHTDFVDINCGCPSSKVVGSHAGSALLATADIFYNFINSLEKELGYKKFSLKMRSGFYDDSEFYNLLSVAQSTHLAQLTLHARTRQDRYKGKARWSLVDHALKTSSFPIVGSGDIVNLQSMIQKLQIAPQLQKVIIGRGALRNPWIFTELKQQKVVKINPNIILYSLAVYALLQEIQTENLGLLFNFIEFSPLLHKSAGLSIDAWQELYETLTQLKFDKKILIQDLNIQRSSMARVKMIWNSLRSSLPAIFMNPQFLRVHQFSDFSKLLSNNIQTIYLNQKEIALNYQAEHDWIYSGERH